MPVVARLVSGLKDREPALRRLGWLAIMVAVLFSTLVWVAGAQEPPTDTAVPSLDNFDPTLRLKIEPALLKQLMENGGELVPIIVEVKSTVDLASVPAGPDTAQRRQAVVATLQGVALRTQAGVLAELAEHAAQGRASNGRSFWIFNGLAAQADLNTVLALAARPDVHRVRRDREFLLTGQTLAEGSSPLPAQGNQWNIAKIRADLVWTALRVDGSGIVLANVDSGVDFLHPALQTRYRGYDPHGLHRHSCNWFDATGEGASYPVDGNGHGTHTMGTMLGGDGIGVAPGATWIAVRAFNNQGQGLESWLHAALQWIVDPGPGCTPARVVNNSWTTSWGGIDVFRSDVQVLRAAGIFAAFAAGNDGPYSSSIDAPASYPEAFSVGALASDDLVANFSSRGPSTWYGKNLIKPEISAPGVAVRSSLPGGAYGERSGTSMATPHVAGVAALMLQADPTLSVDQIETTIKETAVPLSGPVPNNDYGWGRVDAYAAVAAVAGASTLTGVVTRSDDGVPIAGAIVTAEPSTPEPAVRALTRTDGSYVLALAPDRYTLTAAAFGYNPSSRVIQALTNTAHTENFALMPLPTGTLTGRVTSGGDPLVTATITVLGTPIETVADADGVYTTYLPAGIYTVTVTSPGHRVGLAMVPLIAGETTVQDFDLVSAPSILLVDSGAWYYSSQIDYYRQELDELRYTYDLLAINDPLSEVPTADDLLPFDIVFWSSPNDSPGYLDASEVLTTYLGSGGSLFLSGQDVGYYDDYYPFISAPYFRTHLKARFERDNTGITELVGLTDSLFDGLAFSIDGPGGADNQISPDEISLREPDFASSVLHYQADGAGGQQVGRCLPYRAIYLSYGFEAISDPLIRTEIISRSIAWFGAPPATAGAELTPSSQSLIGDFGHTVTHTLRIRNLAEIGPSLPFTITPTAYAWPTSMITDHVTLAPCESAQVALSVQVPATATWAASDSLTITARSATADATATRETRSPAPVLLVDDDRWYNVETHYRNALSASGIAYDEWQVPWSFSGGQPPSPPTTTLQMYPMVLWFSAYDWYQPLTPAEEERLAAYLEGGGRLYYNGQDYLAHTDGPNDFARTYLGVNDYTEDFTSTVATGVLTSPLGSYWGPYALVYPYKNFSDGLTPTLGAKIAFTGQEGQPNALTNSGPDPPSGGRPWRTAFFAFNPDGLEDTANARLMQRVAGWLSWLGSSTLGADKALARDTDTLTYTLMLLNDGWQDMTSAYFTATFTNDLLPFPGSITGGASWDPEQSAIVWSGPLTQGQSLVVTYQAAIAGPLPMGHVVSHTVHMGYDDHHLEFDRIVATPVNVPLLSESSFNVTPSVGKEGSPLTYTLALRNTGVAQGLITASNALPTSLALIPDSLQVSSGIIQVDNRVITWTMPLAVGDVATLTYSAIVTDIPSGFLLLNRVRLDDGLGNTVIKEAIATVEGMPTFLPIILK